ncbi:MAG: tetratricopeptide repeat protein, partial [Anaerolineales bacterium]
MAEVALRTYIEQIESMIDSGQVDEAIAHVRHILEKYPKYVDAYRVLGKAFIEKGRHQDAADIFQRVLSVEPDDFVSHVGMSIVREDESNLDGAIWHMERAYEEQPANAAIQDELKRLYERRDGLEPPRIRLTRGALARMYMKGHLHPQSVAELRAALAEDADRQDLRALLARALWDDQQRVEAAEVSNEILEDLPYCRTANRILSVAWSEGGNDEQARIYRSRLAALDPYEAHSTNGDVVFGAGQVAADSVKLTRLEYRPGVDEFSDDERPDWMQALGAEFDAPGTESDTPDWLRESAEAVASEPSTAPTATGDLPDWLQEAGAAVPAEAAAPAVTSADDGDDVPDWLEAELG